MFTLLIAPHQRAICKLMDELDHLFAGVPAWKPGQGFTYEPVVDDTDPDVDPKQRTIKPSEWPDGAHIGVQLYKHPKFGLRAQHVSIFAPHILGELQAGRHNLEMICRVKEASFLGPHGFVGKIETDDELLIQISNARNSRYQREID